MPKYYSGPGRFKRSKEDPYDWDPYLKPDPEQKSLGEEYDPPKPPLQETLFDAPQEKGEPGWQPEHSVAIVIPSNDRNLKPIDPATLRSFSQAVKMSMNDTFGGFTAFPVNGGFKDPNTGVLHSDEGEMVVSYLNAKDLDMATRFIKEIGHEVKRVLDQHGVLTLVDNQPYLI